MLFVDYACCNKDRLGIQSPPWRGRDWRRKTDRDALPGPEKAEGRLLEEMEVVQDKAAGDGGLSQA